MKREVLRYHSRHEESGRRGWRPTVLQWGEYTVVNLTRWLNLYYYSIKCCQLYFMLGQAAMASDTESQTLGDVWFVDTDNIA